MATPVQRVLFNIVADDVEKTADFYTRIVGLQRHFESDWYIILVPETDSGPMLELGIIASDSQVTPEMAKGAAGGSYLTLVVDNVHDAFDEAEEMGCDIIEAPRDFDYGQTRMLVRDPNGLVVDISSVSS